MLVVALVGVVVELVTADTRSIAAPAPGHTTSLYEVNANARRLYRDGEAAGRAGAQGIVILDFGRPAFAAGSYGTMAFAGTFVPMSAIETAVQHYIRAYFSYAPPDTTLDVAVGTNNSCGTDQPCGAVICGCVDEPPSFNAWGVQLALAVEALDQWTANYKATRGYTDDVEVVAADDAEPAYDPEYLNTYNLLAGYASVVGGTSPAMVDYGSADPAFWTEAQLLQVAYGFHPDVPMPEVYYSVDASEWAALLQYAKTVLGRAVLIQGVLTERAGTGTNDPVTAYTDMLQAAASVTDQQAIPWLSQIG
jgi:hypothetical protein